MASIDKRKGNWRAQVRRGGRCLTKTFRMKADAETWARDAERSIDLDIDPTSSRITTKDSFGTLINLHIDDLATYRKPLRRSKQAVLRRLEAELGGELVANLTRERLIQYGRERAQAGAGPATLAIDISFVGTILTHAAALHGLQVSPCTVSDPDGLAQLCQVGAILAASAYPGLEFNIVSVPLHAPNLTERDTTSSACAS